MFKSRIVRKETGDGMSFSNSTNRSIFKKVEEYMFLQVGTTGNDRSLIRFFRKLIYGPVIETEVVRGEIREYRTRRLTFLLIYLFYGTRLRIFFYRKTYHFYIRKIAKKIVPKRLVNWFIKKFFVQRD